MKTNLYNKVFFKKIVPFIVIICLVFYGIYIFHCLHVFYSFDSLLKEESPEKIAYCSLDVCSSENELTIPIDVDSELFDCLFQALQSKQYTKPLTSILGSTVSAYHIESYPFYRVLLQHEDNHRTEVVVNGNFLLIGSTTESGLTVYQVSDTSLLNTLNSLF